MVEHCTDEPTVAGRISKDRGSLQGSRYMRVTNDFVAEDVIELSIKAGDRVEVRLCTLPTSVCLWIYVARAYHKRIR